MVHPLFKFPGALAAQRQVGGGGGAPNSIVAVVPFTTPTSTGTLDITTTELGGLTPVAALFISNSHLASDPGSESVQGVLGIGGTDGTTQFALAYNLKDNSSLTSDIRTAQNDRCAWWIDPTSDFGSDDDSAAFDSFITNGVRIDFTAADATAREGLCILFAGASVSAHCGFSGSLSSGANDITAPGFEPDVVFAFDNAPANYTGGDVYDPTISMGVAVNDGSDTCKCMSFAHDAFVAQSEPSLTVRSDTCRYSVSPDTYNPTLTATIDGYDSSGFTINSSSVDTTGFPYLAVYLGGDSARLIDFSTPTSTGADTISVSGITPHFGMVFLSGLETRDDSAPHNPSDDASNFALSAFTTNDEASISWRAQNGASNTDTGSYRSDDAISLGDPTSIEDVVASLSSFASGQANMNYSAVNAAGKIAFGLFVGV